MASNSLDGRLFTSDRVIETFQRAFYGLFSPFGTQTAWWQCIDSVAY